MTYFWISVLPLLVSSSFDIYLGRKLLFRKKFYRLVSIFLLLMVFFDSVLTGLPIVQYVTKNTLGISIGSIPIEDFFYGIAFVLTILNIDILVSFTKADYKILLLSSRPFSWVNTAYPALLAVLLSRGYFVVSDLWYLVYFLLPYNLLVYGVNDVYDFASDSQNPRKQSIEGAILPQKLHRLMLWGSLSLSLLFLPLFIYSAVLCGLYITTIFLALAYSVPPVRTKTKPLLDSMTSSLHFVLPAVIGFVIGNGLLEWRVEFLCFFLWGMASHMLGAVPDIIPDKKAGMMTVATLLGGKTTSIIVLILYIASAGVLLCLDKLYIPIAGVVSLYALLPLGLLIKRIPVPILFRLFMYYNLVVGFVITIVVLLGFIQIWG